MQKVEGSNPFSRFEESPAPAGFSASWGLSVAGPGAGGSTALCPFVPN
jgi:hypothetical protein